MDPIKVIISGLVVAAILSVFIFVQTKRRTHGKQASSRKTVPSSATSVEMDRPTKETIDDIIAEHEERECYVYMDATRRASVRPVSGVALRAIIKEYGSPGRLWNMDGKPLYALNLDTNGHYTPCEKFMREDMLNSPRRAYIATQQQAVSTFYQNKDSRNVLQKYGAILLFVGVVLFFMFMTIQS